MLLRSHIPQSLTTPSLSPFPVGGVRSLHAQAHCPHVLRAGSSIANSYYLGSKQTYKDPSPREFLVSEVNPGGLRARDEISDDLFWGMKRT